MHKWQLQEAKNKLSSLIETAIHDGAQCITRRGEDTVVVMSMEEYKKLKGKKRSLKEHLLNAPKIDGLDIKRVKGKAREIDL